MHSSHAAAAIFAASSLVTMAACSALVSFDDLRGGVGGATDGALDRAEIPEAASQAIDGGAGEDAATGYAAAILADHPVAYFRLDEIQGNAIDRSGSMLSGDYGSAVARGAAGLVGDLDTASTFPGSSDKNGASVVTVARNAALEPATTVSVECWIRSDVTPSGEIASYGGNLDAPFQPWVLQTNPGGHLQMYAAPGRYVTGGIGMVAQSTYHLVTVYDGTRMYLYVNAAIDAVVAVNGGPLSNYGAAGGAGLTIGGGTKGSLPFRGTVDEVAVYNYPLTVQQITAHYAAGGGK